MRTFSLSFFSVLLISASVFGQEIRSNAKQPTPAEILVKGTAADAERIKVATQHLRTPPKITVELQTKGTLGTHIRGDLTDAQRLYAAIKPLDPPFKMKVVALPHKRRKELVLSGLSEKQSAALVEQKKDPYVELIKGGVDGFTFIYMVAYWDILQKKPELLQQQENSTIGKLTRGPADFYGVLPNVLIGDIPDAIGWKQLEVRGVEVVYPAQK